MRLLLLLLLVFVRIAVATETTVTIYNTGDLHAQTANLPRIAAYVNARRLVDPNVLLVDAGDLFNRGDLAVRVTEGEAMFHLMAVSGYDACVLGNHGLSHGAARVAELTDRFRFPLTEANGSWSGGLQPQAARMYRIFGLDGVRVAVIGTSSEHMNHRRDDLVERQRIDVALRELLPAVRRQADIVVLLTHVGSQRDREVAAQLAAISPPYGVDLIVGGHDHKAYQEMVYDEATQTVIQHAGDHGRFLGEVVLTWDGELIVDRQARLLPITPDMPLDPKAQACRQSYLDAFPEDAPITQITRPLSREEGTAWVADAIRNQTGVQAVLAPSGLVRQALPAGELTGKGLLAAVPCLDVVEFTVPDAADLPQVAAAIQALRVESLVAAARARSGDGEKWAEDMLRLVGPAPNTPAPERTPEERKAFAKISQMVLSPGPLLLFPTADLPTGPIRVAYPCTWHDTLPELARRGLSDQELTRGPSLWHIVRAALATGGHIP